MRRALAAALSAPLLLAACGGDGGTAASGPGGARGADAPVLTCQGLDSPLPGAAQPSPRPSGNTTALPNLTLDCLGGGDPVGLRTLRGPMVINVWASWCKPCLAELPYLTEAHAELGERVRFLGVAVQDADTPSREWLSYHGVPWPSLADRKGSVRGPLRIPGPPVTLFVNSAGRIAAVHYGAFTSARAVRDAVAEHLQVS
ncbi:TlpA family protein disulfide reductase [Sporichthya polymorpha]|uniref:TlpA family protein disulfide reductase n=1 Tax=Sporichthya polymorpha TaxID=35751 RepID=UPI00037E6745|nr:TlpA disulfide reductase family protein [Sporichthya polymorpha]